jgi:hypothetical protein
VLSALLLLLVLLQECRLLLLLARHGMLHLQQLLLAP